SMINLSPDNRKPWLLLLHFLNKDLHPNLPKSFPTAVHVRCPSLAKKSRKFRLRKLHLQQCVRIAESDSYPKRQRGPKESGNWFRSRELHPYRRSKEF